MRFYAISFDDLLRAPLKRFWFLLRQIDRLHAEDDLRMIRAAASASSSESYEAASKHLTEQLGDVFVFEEVKKIVIDPKTGLDPEFDRAGLHALKAALQA